MTSLLDNVHLLYFVWGQFDKRNGPVQEGREGYKQFFEACCLKISLQGFRPGPTQTGMYAHRLYSILSLNLLYHLPAKETVKAYLYMQDSPKYVFLADLANLTSDPVLKCSVVL